MEIAIVLVVIGLLLGGILKGQQLINSARVRNLADQNSGVQAAYYGFIDRFRNLPGDMLCATATTAVGNAITCTAGSEIGGVGATGGNGRIDTLPEAGAVWAHLSVAGFLNGTYSGSTPAAGNPANYLTTGVSSGAIPPNAFQGPILLAHMNDFMDGITESGVTRLAFSFGGNIPVPLLRDLDQKLDDGISGTGVMRSAFGAAARAGTFGVVVEAVVAAGNDCNNTAVAPATWFVDSTNTTCNAIFLY